MMWAACDCCVGGGNSQLSDPKTSLSFFAPYPKRGDVNTTFLPRLNHLYEYYYLQELQLPRNRTDHIQ